MNEQDFANWLKGFIDGAETDKGLSKKQVEKIKEKLDTVDVTTFSISPQLMPRYVPIPCGRPHADWPHIPSPFYVISDRAVTTRPYIGDVLPSTGKIEITNDQLMGENVFQTHGNNGVENLNKLEFVGSEFPQTRWSDV